MKEIRVYKALCIIRFIGFSRFRVHKSEPMASMGAEISRTRL